MTTFIAKFTSTAKKISQVWLRKKGERKEAIKKAQIKKGKKAKRPKKRRPKKMREKERRDNVTILFPHLCFKVAP